MKADLAIYTHVLVVSGQYESVALMLSHKMDFNCCANRDGFRTSSHIQTWVQIHCIVFKYKYKYYKFSKYKYDCKYFGQDSI